MGTGSTHVTTRLSTHALGFAFGLTFAILMFAIGMLAWYLKIGSDWVRVASSIYIGFTLTPLGVLVGALWAFVEGFILGVLVAFFYNFALKLCHCKGCHPTDAK